MQNGNLIVNTLKLCSVCLPGIELILLDSTVPVSSRLFVSSVSVGHALQCVLMLRQVFRHGFHLEALYLFWCSSVPESLDLLKSSVYFFSRVLSVSGILKSHNCTVSLE